MVDQVGLNHLTWIRAVRARRPRRAARADGRRTGTRSPSRRLSRCRCSRSSASSPRPTSTTSTATTRCSREQLDGTPRAEVVAEIERGLLELYRDPALNEKPALLEQRGGAFYSEAATGLVASLVSGDGAVHEVDVRNNGTLAGLADDDVVEVPARVEGGRLVPLPQEPLAPELLGLASTSPRTSASPPRRR